MSETALTTGSPDGFYDSWTLGVPIPLDCLPVEFLRFEIDAALGYLAEREAELERRKESE